MTQLATLTASDGQSGDYFGYSVGVGGNTIIVGAFQASVNGNRSQGAAYVFVEPMTGWVNMSQTAKLTASDGNRQDRWRPSSDERLHCANYEHVCGPTRF